MEQSSDDGVAEMPPRPRRYINSANGRRSRDIFDDDSDAGSENDIESDTQSDDDDDSDSESKPDPNSSSKYAVFQQFYDETKRVAEKEEEEGEEEMTIDERRKDFRDKLLAVTKTYFNLKKHPTFKTIMETVLELKTGAGGYDMTEALERGFEQRKFLLDRVYNYLEDQDEGSEDDESDDDDNDSKDDDSEENVSYRAAREFPSVYS